MLCDNLEVWDKLGGGREETCIPKADSHCCMAETNTTS